MIKIFTIWYNVDFVFVFIALNHTKKQRKCNITPYGVSLVSAPKGFGVPLYLHIAVFFLFLCAILGTLGLPDTFDGSGGAV